MKGFHHTRFYVSGIQTRKILRKLKTMATTETKTKIFDLLEVANQIALTAKALQDKVNETGEPVIIKAINLVKKYPEFKVMGDTPIFKLRIGQDGQFYTDTLNVFKDGQDAVSLYDVDLDPVKVKHAFNAYQTGISGYVIITVSGQQFKTAISLDPVHLKEIVKTGEPFSGEGIPSASFVKLVPNPITPIYSDLLTVDTVYEIVADNGQSQEFNTQLVTVKSESGKLVKRVTCNSDLNRVYTSHGIGAKFKIVSKTLRKNKDGEIYENTTGKTEEQWEKAKSKGEVSGEFKPQYKVKILDLQLDDFSDFTF